MSSPLHLDVFVVPYRPIVGQVAPMGEGEATWPANAVSLISGERDAVLIDALLTPEDAGHEGRTDKGAAVREILSSPLIVVTPQTTVDECMALMTDRRIRHVPELDGGEVVGIVSIGHVVKFKSKQQSFEIKFLHDYIGAS
jgi:CBS domain-containing protein